MQESGCIECPYHGWSFDGSSGACASVPQAKDAEAALGCRLLTLKTQERNGIVFAWAAPLYGDSTEPDEKKLSRVALDDIFNNENLKVSGTDYARDLPMDATMLTENVLDPSHLPFTHHDTISKRSNAKPMEFFKKKKDNSAAVDGFTFEKRNGSVCFQAPMLVVSSTDRGIESFKDWNVVYAVPSVPGKCRLYVRVVFQVDKIPQRAQRFLLKTIFERAPPFVAHLSNHRVLEDDNYFLHHANRDYALSEAKDSDSQSYDVASEAAKPGIVPRRPLFPRWRQRLYVPTSADACVVAFRRWLDDFTLGYGPVYTPYLPLDCQDQAAPPFGQQRHAILERTNSHTNICRSCSAAKIKLQRASTIARSMAYVSLLASFLSSSVFPQKKLLLPVMSLLGLGAFALHTYLDSNLLPQFDRGLYPPPRNIIKK